MEMKIFGVDFLFSEYHKNNIRFNRTYMGKELIVKGVITQMHEVDSPDHDEYSDDEYEDHRGPYFCVFIGEPRSCNGMPCYFSAEYEKIILELNCGDMLAVRGTLGEAGVFCAPFALHWCVVG
ncbi:MAG TPA: hypothetical protein PK364_11575 [Synergistaceae bacterium]|nr:hypothetical protein [Synergistaceae bacterium]HPJ27114.1 hypothetical protein [Synergistaceae bacterium]